MYALSYRSMLLLIGLHTGFIFSECLLQLGYDAPSRSGLKEPRFSTLCNGFIAYCTNIFFKRIQRKQWAYNSFLSYLFYKPFSLYIYAHYFFWFYLYWPFKTKYGSMHGHMYVHHLHDLFDRLSFPHPHLHYLPYF